LSSSARGQARPSLEHLASEEVERLGPQEYILEIDVAKNGFLETVRWDGKTMAILTRSVDSPRTASAGHGSFGMAVHKGSGVLSTARWLISDRN
jgi:hypothetical protein